VTGQNRAARRIAVVVAAAALAALAPQVWAQAGATAPSQSHTARGLAALWVALTHSGGPPKAPEPVRWPLVFALTSWVAWFASWIAAAFWSKRAEARAQRSAEWVYSVLVYAGFALLVLPTLRANYGPRLWNPPEAVKWAVAALVPLGFGLAWWARIHLGRDWSWNVRRKEDHRLVDTGPYAVVRHPIYTGILLASVATAVLEAKWPSFAGLALLTLGLWLKASLEERFLSRELGAIAYGDYVARTGRLLPRL